MGTFHHTTADSESLLSSTASSSRRIFQPFGSLHYSTQSAFKMSWQAYVDSSMVASGHVDKGAIYSIAGDSKWAASPNFDVSATEMKEIINGLSGKVDALYAEGLHVGGERYVLTKAEDRSLYARKGRGRRHREDQASYPHCSLWRVHDCRELSNNRRATRRLPHQVRLLEHIHTWEGEGW